MMSVIPVAFCIIAMILTASQASTNAQHDDPTPTPTLELPKTIHFIWWQGLDDLHARSRNGQTATRNSPDWRAQYIPRWIESWKRNHPTSQGWTHLFWDEAKLLQLAKELGYGDVMHSFHERIKKIDLSRYLILFKHGGIVSDVDFESFKPIDSLVAGHSAVLVEESQDATINCAWIASVPKHPLWIKVLKEISKRQVQAPNSGVMYITGPKMLTHVSQEWERDRALNHKEDGYDVKIYTHASNENRLFYPYNADHMSDAKNRELMVCFDCACCTHMMFVDGGVIVCSFFVMDSFGVLCFVLSHSFRIGCYWYWSFKQSSSCSEANACAAEYPDSYAMHHFAATWYDHYKIEIGL